MLTGNGKMCIKKKKSNSHFELMIEVNVTVLLHHIQIYNRLKFYIRSVLTYFYCMKHI